MMGAINNPPKTVPAPTAQTDATAYPYIKTHDPKVTH